MRKTFTLRFGMIAFAAGVAFVVALSPRIAESQTPEKLPKIEKKEHKDYTEKLTDKVSFEMIAIPGGNYLMGSPKTEGGRNEDEGPQHPVSVKPFWMGKLEVTWDEFDLFWEKKPGQEEPKTEKDKAAAAVTRPTPPGYHFQFGLFDNRGPGMPAMCMSYHSAQEYCRFLRAKTGKAYRLPTEAEWEWACRAGTTTAYSWGDDPKQVGDYAWYQENAKDQIQKCGVKKANPWGLHDMHGNVSEWCFDRYEKDTYAKSPADKLSLSPVVMPIPKRYPYVTRGGSFIDPAERCRSAFRRASHKDWLERDPQRPQSIWWMTDAEYVGLRVTCPVEANDTLKNYQSKFNRDTTDF
ncbi:MAG: formylglycine-generating enzyme family protein, partial [Gemmataceae bacterium]